MLIAFGGLAVLFIALVGTVSGRTLGRGSADRATEPFKYWLTLVVQYLVAAYLLWFWFYKADH